MRLTGFIAICILLAGSVLASVPVTDLIKKAGGPEKYPGSSQLIIFDTTIVDVQESGLSYVHNHMLYKILTADGAKQLSVVKFDYDPLSAYVEIKKVVIYRKNGETIELDMSKVMDYPAPAHMIYWGARQKMIEVGRLEPGDAVEVFMFRKGFTYALLYDEGDDRYIPPMKGHFYDIVNFWNDFPVITKYYETNIPSTKTVCYKFFNGTPDSLITRGPEKTSYSFTMRDMKPYKHEPQMVALSDVAPKLLISTSPDWESKSMWFYGVNEDYGSFESTPAIDKKVAEILEGAGDEMDSISRLTHWVADNIRYSGISMGKGEGYTLHKGEMNFTDRCGVCKDKAGMLVTMLRAAGFDSYAAMTMAGSRIDDIPADQFNHSVTVVRLHNGEYKMLDPTWVPFLRELWSSREQQQNYLMGLPEGADLMEIPISPPENHYIKINGTSSVLKNGTIEGELVIEAEGQSDANIRSFFTRSYKADWGKLMEEEFLAVSPQFKIKEIQYPENPYDYSEPIKISVKYTINDYATVTDEEIIFIPVAATELFKKAMGHMYFETENETREFPFKDRCSQMVEITETVSLPGLTEAVWLPVSESIQGTGGSFYGGYELDGNKLVIHEKALFPKRVYEPEDWDSYRSVVIARKKFAKENVILKFK